MLFLSPTPSYVKKSGQNGPQTGFFRGGHKTHKTAQDAFDRVQLIGLIVDTLLLTLTNSQRGSNVPSLSLNSSAGSS